MEMGDRDWDGYKEGDGEGHEDDSNDGNRDDSINLINTELSERDTKHMNMKHQVLTSIGFQLSSLTKWMNQSYQ